jgi:hypothetical protein
LLGQVLGKCATVKEEKFRETSVDRGKLDIFVKKWKFSISAARRINAVFAQSYTLRRQIWLNFALRRVALPTNEQAGNCLSHFLFSFLQDSQDRLAVVRFILDEIVSKNSTGSEGWYDCICYLEVEKRLI